MIARRSFLTIAASLGTSLGLGGCGGESFSYRYRLSIEVDTPEGVKRGSGVLKVWAAISYSITGKHLGGDTNGEAVAVDLGPRGLLFALLKREGRSGRLDELSGDVMLRAGLTTYENETYVHFTREVAAIRGVIEVLPEELPMLVRFRDIADPATVEKVDPEHLDVSFGAGVRLKRATIEITSDPVTTGIEKRLGWLPRLHGSIATMQGIELPYTHLLNQLTNISFWEGTRR